jgi:hypothetical protein
MRAWPLILAAALLLAGACGNKDAASSSASLIPSPMSVASLASDHGLHLVGGTATTLPQTLDSLPWASYQSACQKNGFDLRPYRGKRVVFAAYPLQERHHGAPATLWTVSAAGDIVGAYVSVDGELGGVWSLDEAAAGFSSR